MIAVEVGAVYYIYNEQITPANNKYMVCVVVSNNLFLCLNTLNRKMYECIPIYQKTNRFLKYDSFLSCNRTFHFSDNQLKQAKFVGHLSYENIVALKTHIENNVKTLSPIEKARIIESLSEVLKDY